MYQFSNKHKKVILEYIIDRDLPFHEKMHYQNSMKEVKFYNITTDNEWKQIYG